MELKYFKDLDGVRGMAALMVMWFHFAPDGNPATHPLLHLISKVSIFGQTGVILFFVLSGFLITRILLFVKNKPHYFRNFYIKRSLRIFPLYYLGLAIYYYFNPGTFTSHNAWMYWVYLQNFAATFNWDVAGPGHFWSLAIEEHFYLFWPLLVYYTPQRHFTKLMGVIIALAFVCRIVLMHFGYGTFLFTFSAMDCLVIGAILAWVERENLLPKFNFPLIAIGSIAVLFPAWLLFGAGHLDFVQLLKQPMIALFYMGVIGTIISKPTWLNKVFGSGLLRFTGKISYGLYVFHPLGFGLYSHFFTGNAIWVAFIGSFGFSYLIATASFYLFESHFTKLKKYFEPKEWKEKQALQFEK